MSVYNETMQEKTPLTNDSCDLKSEKEIVVKSNEEDTKERGSSIKIKFQKTCLKLKINPHLFFLKITLFIMYGATSALIPYLTNHMQSIGLNVEDIAVMYGVLPLTTFLAPPLTGYLVDKLGNYKPVVAISLIFNMIFHHVLIFIPVQEFPATVPAAYVVRHPNTGGVEVWWSPCPSRECPKTEDIDVVVGGCEDYCLLDNKNQISKPRKYPVLPLDIAVMPPNLLNLKNPLYQTVQKMEEEKKERSNKVKVKKRRKQANDTSEDLVFHFDSHKNKTALNRKSKIKKKEKIIKNRLNLHKPIQDREQENEEEKEDEEQDAFFFIELHKNLADPIEQLGLEVEDEDDDETVTDFRTRFGEELLMEAGVNITALEEFDLRCGGNVLATNLTSFKLKDLTSDCMLQKCNFKEGGPDICPPDFRESDDKTFWIYFLLRFAGTTMLTSCVTIMDPIALVLIQQHGGEFGRERLFSSIGMALFAPITGVLMDYYSEGLGYTDYSVAFYLYDILLAIAIVTVYLMPPAPRLPPDDILKDIVAIVKMPHVILFIIFLFLLGNFWGFIECYAFIFLKELGANNYILGITVTVGTVCSMPFLYGADRITKKLGHINIIVSAFFLHAVRLMGYSFIEDVLWCFPFEAMEALAVHLMWIAAATYCALLAPKNLLATLIGILGMSHFSLGRGSGSFVGGFLIKEMGTRKSFRFLGLTAIGSGIIYFLLHNLWLRHLKVVKQLEYQYKTEMAERDREMKKKKGPLMKDVAVSAERLSLMIEFYNRGSLTSLQKSAQHLQRASASKVDLLRSTLDMNNRRFSNPSVQLKNSFPNLRTRHDSFGKDKGLKDSQTNISPITQKKSQETLTTLEELTILKNSSKPIIEEEEPNNKV